MPKSSANPMLAALPEATKKKAGKPIASASSANPMFPKPAKCNHCFGTGRKPDNKAVGVKLRKLREKEGVKANAVSAHMGISAPFLCELELGNKTWTLALKEKFEKAVAELTPKKTE